MDKYIKVSYFWPNSAKKIFVYKGCPKNWKKMKKYKKFFIFFFIKPILSIIYELCQHLESLRSLCKAPESKTLIS